MREFVTMHRTAIVIDDAEHLQTELDDIKDLLDEPSEARVIVINRLHLPLSHVLASVHLSDLNQDDALKLIRMLADAQFRRNDEQISDDEIWYVWSAAGGNPGAIQNRVAEFAGGLYILK
jgi:hypothetical protein